MADMPNFAKALFQNDLLDIEGKEYDNFHQVEKKEQFDNFVSRRNSETFVTSPIRRPSASAKGISVNISNNNNNNNNNTCPSDDTVTGTSYRFSASTPRSLYVAVVVSSILMAIVTVVSVITLSKVSDQMEEFRTFQHDILAALDAKTVESRHTEVIHEMQMLKQDVVLSLNTTNKSVKEIRHDISVRNVSPTDDIQELYLSVISVLNDTLGKIEQSDQVQGYIWTSLKQLNESISHVRQAQDAVLPDVLDSVNKTQN